MHLKGFDKIENILSSSLCADMYNILAKSNPRLPILFSSFFKEDNTYLGNRLEKLARNYLCIF